MMLKIIWQNKYEMLSKKILKKYSKEGTQAQPHIKMHYKIIMIKSIWCLFYMLDLIYEKLHSGNCFGKKSKKTFKPPT